MMGLFYLTAVYGLIRCGDSTHPYGWGAVTVAATLLSLGSKEVAVSLPIMILLFDRVLLSGSFAEIGRRRWGMYLALLAAWGAFALLQLRVGPRTWAGYALPLSWFEYACSQPGVILHYLWLAFWPHPLVLDYGWPPARTVGARATRCQERAASAHFSPFSSYFACARYCSQRTASASTCAFS